MSTDKPKSATEVASSDVLGDLWNHLQEMDHKCFELGLKAYTRVEVNRVRDRRMAIQEIMWWMEERGLKPNREVSDAT